MLLLKLTNKLRQFGTCARGAVAVTFAVSGVALAMVVGIGVDYAQMTRHQSSLQAIADGAAVAAAQEISLVNSKTGIIDSVAKAYVKTNSKTGDSISTTTLMLADKTGLAVNLTNSWKPFFAHYFVDGVTPISASATARVVGTGTVCMIGLDATKINTIHLKKSARLDARGCGVFANSVHAKAINVDTGAAIFAALTCSVGGVDGLSKASITPDPVTDCPKLADPLAARQPPVVGSCDFNGTKIVDEIRTLFPGTYCKGLIVKGTSKVKLMPGIYVITGGKLEVTDTATFEGDYVGFYLDGDKAKISFKKQTTINLTAPKDGIMAGLLMFEDRSASNATIHRITSDNARMLLGTIYLVNGTLRIDAEGPVADNAAYTAIIARTIELDEGPTLYLNSDYKATDVPLPAGLLGGTVVLSK